MLDNSGYESNNYHVINNSDGEGQDSNYNEEGQTINHLQFHDVPEQESPNVQDLNDEEGEQNLEEVNVDDTNFRVRRST
jgi:hypothetical protein